MRLRLVSWASDSDVGGYEAIARRSPCLFWRRTTLRGERNDTTASRTAALPPGHVVCQIR